MMKNSMQSAVSSQQENIRQRSWRRTAHCPLPPARYSRGFTLLISIILTSVIVTVGLALLDVAYKQVVLSSSAKGSEYAFYAADSALECALYWDQKYNAFDYSSSNRNYPTITCNNLSINPAFDDSGSTHISTFTQQCAGGGTAAVVTIYRQASGQATIYTDGYSSCNTSDPHRIERGLKLTY